MKAFFNLIRWQNLLIVVLTMILIRYALLEPVLGKLTVTLNEGSGAEVPVTLQFSLFNFILLVLATVFITAGGYVINDYFDIRTDLINKGSVIVGTRIERRQAMMLHNIFNIAGVALGFYISWRSGYFLAGMLFLVVSGLLYFYSASYKRQFLLGNIVVAVLTGMVPLLVGFYEWPALYRYYSVNAVNPPDFDFIFYWIGGFAFFAFLTTLTREIIKDIEDFEGDVAYGRNTLPIVLGIKTAKIIASFLNLITIALLYIIWHLFLYDNYTLVYISAVLALPLFLVIFIVFRSTDRKRMHSASRLMKIVMLGGILYSLVVKALLTWNLI
ncbi:MAG TPA: geranylgeranylglycerol-phosphate geranylgeranyltransferase [Bacteroidales bacterium]|nr:geranylgeranylglycerol-phosphate geranylgeranyltransferase [Bacteroidales bacterium]